MPYYDHCRVYSTVDLLANGYVNEALAMGRVLMRQLTALTATVSLFLARSTHPGLTHCNAKLQWEKALLEDQQNIIWAIWIMNE